MIDVEDIRKLLYSLLDGDKIRESKVDFGITTTLLPSMKMMKIYKEDMKYNPLEYILSSIYLPIFSRQRILDNKQYIDIARYRRYPVEMLKEKGCNNIYVVNIEAHNPNRVRKPMERVYNNGEEVTFIDYEDKPSILDFTAEQSAKNLKNGYETTAKVLEKKKKTMII